VFDVLIIYCCLLKASSTFKHGVLEVVVPKLEKARRIKVDVA
jgi:HSP20 family molecular chaperone IbpA